MITLKQCSTPQDIYILGTTVDKTDKFLTNGKETQYMHPGGHFEIVDAKRLREVLPLLKEETSKEGMEDTAGERVMTLLKDFVGAIQLRVAYESNGIKKTLSRIDDRSKPISNQPQLEGLEYKQSIVLPEGTKMSEVMDLDELIKSLEEPAEKSTEPTEEKKDA